MPVLSLGFEYSEVIIRDLLPWDRAEPGGPEALGVCKWSCVRRGFHTE